METRMVGNGNGSAAVPHSTPEAAQAEVRNTFLLCSGKDWADRIRSEVGKAVVGQEAIVERLLVALLADGHVLLEGMPGLAKTLLVKSLATTMGLDFERIQFTPDLLPSDVVGTMVFQPQNGTFGVHLGPVFANLVLADEINRAPAKVQSALLEAMQERQVTIGGQSHPLPRPFLVMATQNPVEQEGTYPLPEAQTDRFLFKLLVDYPSEHDEQGMLQRWSQITTQPQLSPVSSVAELLALRAGVDRIHVSEPLRRYVLALVRATRDIARAAESPRSTGPRPLAFGASPRATLALVQAARALAFVRDDTYATPAHVQELFLDTCRHRVGLTYEAEAERLSADSVLGELLARTPIPTGESSRI
ncbi:MoxR family ATPase [Candidatus Binatia bacterium]|nr:MoxR family ATPase [Candidatus Binatia bacterium]